MTPQQLNKCLHKFRLSARRLDETFYNKKSPTAILACIARRANSFVRPFVGILSQIKLLFGLVFGLVIQLVWYILKQLFTSVALSVGENGFAAQQISTTIHLQFVTYNPSRSLPRSQLFLTETYLSFLRGWAQIV